MFHIIIKQQNRLITTTAYKCAEVCQKCVNARLGSAPNTAYNTDYNSYKTSLVDNATAMTHLTHCSTHFDPLHRVLTITIKIKNNKLSFTTKNNHDLPLAITQRVNYKSNAE